MEFLSTQTGSAKRAAIAIAVCAAAFAGTVDVNAQNWKGTQLSSLTEGTKVYLYNVGSKEFVGIGGRWGTQAMVTTVGLPFEVASVNTTSGTLMLKSTLKAAQDTKAYLTFMDGALSEHDTQNFFVDQYNDTNSLLTLSSVSSTDNQYIYKITVSGQSSSSYSGTYYLTNVGNTLLGESEADGANSQWIIVTQQEREEYFQEAEADDATSVPCSFLIDNQGFTRNNALTSWYVNPSGKDYTNGSNLAYYTTEEKVPTDAIPTTTTTYTHTYTGTCTGGRNGHDVTKYIVNYVDGDTQKENTPTYDTTCGGTHNSGEKNVNLTYSSTTSETTTTTGYTYYVGNGLKDADVTYDPITGETVDKHNLQQEYGGDWTANIHGATGKVYQTITPLREGWYKISCVGFTTAEEGTAQLFAQVADNTTEGKKCAVEDIKNIESTAAPATYVAASRLINDNTGYDRSVMVYVAKSGNSYETITFGINVADADETSWTCFDNFQLEYFGNPSQTLVLDEMQTDVAYINNQRKGLETDGSMSSDDFTGQRTLYLNRTLNEGIWNSIVLPVDLTVSQVKSAFGDDVRISEFKGATDENRPGTIIFTAISANRSNGTETAIKAGNLYLIKPSSTAAYVTGDEVSANGSSDVKIKTYYTIPQVVFNPGKDYESGRIEGSTGDETWGSDTQVKFVGTLVQLGDENKIPVNSYVLNGNNKGGTAGVWYYRTKQTASKGFRGWLETVDGTPSSKIVYDLNGVEETAEGSTTSIDNVLNESKAQHLTGAVYTLSGQMVRSDAISLTGLPSGIYVVGGQKVVVK